MSSEPTSFGRYLEQARELRGVSLEEVARVTKISPGTLRAIEADHFERVPGRVYMIGYLRAYAQAVGLDPDEVVLRYDEMVGSEPTGETKVVPEAQSSPRRAWLGLLFALLAVAVLVWVLFLR